jgi:hypothetical protein
MVFPASSRHLNLIDAIFPLYTHEPSSMGHPQGLFNFIGAVAIKEKYSSSE